MQPRLPALAALVVSLLALSPGCALVTKGFHQSVAIASVPAGATVLIDGKDVGETPLNVTLSRVHTHRLELRKEGFATATQFIQSRADEYLGRTVRFGVDIDSGAANDLIPATINVELAPAAVAATPTGGDDFNRMTAAVLAADDLWHRGAVSEAEHSEMIGKILAQFAR